MFEKGESLLQKANTEKAVGTDYILPGLTEAQSVFLNNEKVGCVCCPFGQRKTILKALF